jgi:hypothetical protein
MWFVALGGVVGLGLLLLYAAWSATRLSLLPEMDFGAYRSSSADDAGQPAANALQPPRQ